MAVKTDELRSADDIVTAPVKELMAGGQPWHVDRIYQKDTLVTEHDPSFQGELAHKQFFSLVDNNIGNDPLTDTVNWIEDNVVKYLSKDTTVTVGAGGHFTTIPEAIENFGAYTMTKGAKLTIHVIGNHVIDYKFHIFNVSIDNSPVIIADNPISIDVSASGLNPVRSLILNDSTTPMIWSSVIFNFTGTSPIVGQAILFEGLGWSFNGCTFNLNCTLDNTAASLFHTCHSITNCNIVNNGATAFMYLIWSGVKVHTVKFFGTFGSGSLMYKSAGVYYCDDSAASGHQYGVRVTLGEKCTCTNNNLINASVYDYITERSSMLQLSSNSTAKYSQALNTISSSGILLG